MPTWTKSTGSSGTMKIEDDGTHVEFWIKAGSSTFMHEMPWAYVVNGTSSSWREFDFGSGGSYQLVATFTVTTDQTVQFKLGDTGTSGLGGPTTLSAAIERASVPPAPTTPVLDQVDNNSMRANTNSNGTGGLTVDVIQIGYGTNSSAPTTFRSADLSNGIEVLPGLAPGTRYYVWARMHNAKGYSAWSGRASAVTWDTPPAPTIPSATSITQTTVSIKFTSNGGGGGTDQPGNTGYQIGYGTSPTVVGTVISSDGTTTITGLTPGQLYYFWARAVNSIGNSPWSARASARTVAGAHVTVGGVPKDAIVWVKVAGVWKATKPWVKIVGVWKETK